MKRAADGLSPVVNIDRRLAQPIHRQVYDGYRQAILDGRLRPGQRLPSTRTLAAELEVSRIPVVTAFAQLAAEGYVDSRVGAGTNVAVRLPIDCEQTQAPSTGASPGNVERLPVAEAARAADVVTEMKVRKRA